MSRDNNILSKSTYKNCRKNAHGLTYAIYLKPSQNMRLTSITIHFIFLNISGLSTIEIT